MEFKLIFKDWYCDIMSKGGKKVSECLAFSGGFDKSYDFLNLLNVIVLSLDVDGRVVFINRKGCEILECSKEDILGKDWFDNFIPKRVRGEVKGVFEMIMRGELKPVEYYVNPVLTKGGKERVISWRNTILYDESGKIVRVLSVGEDITQLELQNRTLRVLYELTRGLVSEKLEPLARARKVTEMCVKEFGVSLAWIGRAESDGSVRILAWYPEDHDYVKDLIIRWDDTPYGRGSTGRAISKKEAIVIEDVTLNGGFSPWREKALAFKLRSVASFPMILKDGVYGVLTVYSDSVGFFNEDLKEIFQVMANIAASALENAFLFEESQKKLKMLQALRNIDLAITGSLDPNLTLNVILNEVIHALEVDAATFLKLNTWTKELEYVAGRGLIGHRIKDRVVRLGEGIAGKSALEKRILWLEKFDEAEPRLDVFEEEGFVSYVAAPLISKGRILGVLELFARKPLEIKEDWLSFLEALTNQLAIALDNLELLTDLEKANVKLFQAYESTIEALAKALELKDRETEGHSERVVALTLKIAKKLGLEGDDLLNIRRGALLHDLGKLAIPDSVLLKPDKLTDEEWEIMKKHPVYAFELLSKIEYLRPALDIPYYHHERWDGSGYPKGLKGEEIPLPARIFAVVDVYDALTHDRPYRKAWSEEEAIEYIKRESGRLFDPKVVKAFLEVIEEKRK